MELVIGPRWQSSTQSLPHGLGVSIFRHIRTPILSRLVRSRRTARETLIFAALSEMFNVSAIS
jgi:hypothetical protein